MERIISDEPIKECVLIFSSLLNNFKNGLKKSTNVCSHHSHYEAEMFQWESIG